MYLSCLTDFFQVFFKLRNKKKFLFFLYLFSTQINIYMFINIFEEPNIKLIMIK